MVVTSIHVRSSLCSVFGTNSDYFVCAQFRPRRLIVHKYSWFTLRTNFVSNDFIILIIIMYVVRGRRRHGVARNARNLLFLFGFSIAPQPRTSPEMFFFCGHRNRAIESTTIFSPRGGRRRHETGRNETNPNFGTGTVKNCLALKSEFYSNSWQVPRISCVSLFGCALVKLDPRAQRDRKKAKREKKRREKKSLEKCVR